jgi:hypothetical protein
MDLFLRCRWAGSTRGWPRSRRGPGWSVRPCRKATLPCQASRRCQFEEGACARPLGADGSDRGSSAGVRFRFWRVWPVWTTKEGGFDKIRSAFNGLSENSAFKSGSPVWSAKPSALRRDEFRARSAACERLRGLPWPLVVQRVISRKNETGGPLPSASSERALHGRLSPLQLEPEQHRRHLGRSAFHSSHSKLRNLGRSTLAPALSPGERK